MRPPNKQADAELFCMNEPSARVHEARACSCFEQENRVKNMRVREPSAKSADRTAWR